MSRLSQRTLLSLLIDSKSTRLLYEIWHALAEENAIVKTKESIIFRLLGGMLANIFLVDVLLDETSTTAGIDRFWKVNHLPSIKTLDERGSDGTKMLPKVVHQRLHTTNGLFCMLWGTIIENGILELRNTKVCCQIGVFGCSWGCDW